MFHQFNSTPQKYVPIYTVFVPHTLNKTWQTVVTRAASSPDYSHQASALTIAPVISRIIVNPLPVLSQDDTAPRWVAVYFLCESLAYFVPLHLHGGLPAYFRCREMSVESSINGTQCHNEAPSNLNAGPWFQSDIDTFSTHLWGEFQSRLMRSWMRSCRTFPGAAEGNDG